MLHHTSTRLDELLIRHLASRPGMSGVELQEAITAAQRPCSIQGVLHELRKLKADGVVMKHEGKWSLSLVWASEFMSLADQIYDHYLSNVPEPWIMPEEGKRKTWTFPTLERANDVQVQMLSLLLNATGEKRVFQWYPYPVLTLFRANQSMRLQQLLETTERVAFRIVGDRGPLSRDCLRRWNKRCVTFSDAVSSFESERENHLSVVGEYVVTLSMTKDYTAKVADIFRDYRTIGDALTRGAFAALRERGKFKVTLEHKTRKANELRRRFVEYFGLVGEAVLHPATRASRE